MKNSDYWKERFTQLEAAQNQKGAAAYLEIEQLYRQAEKEIEGSISTWYQRFASNNGVSMAEARKLLSGNALKEFKWDVNDYIQHGRENAIDGRWMKELENASARFHITRLEALKLQTQQSLELMFGNQMDRIDSAMKHIYLGGYYHTAYELQKGFGIGWDIAGLDQAQIEKVIRKPWAADGKNFSERIWNNKQTLISELHKELTQNIMLGQDPQKAIDAIAKKMNTSKRNAGRLVMTEEAYFSSAAQKDCFHDLDVEQYEIVATLDSHTSDLCRNMDGKVFPMKDFEVGITAPPFHVWCRSTTVPHFDEDFGQIGKRAARDEKTGKTCYVPANMKYEDWKKSFVVGDKTGLKEAPLDDIIKAENISDSLTNIQKNDLNRLLNETSEKAKNVWEMYSSQIIVENPNFEDVPHYNLHGISINISKISNDIYVDVGDGPELYRKAYNELFHECGHAIDNIAGRNLSGGTFEAFYSENFISGKYKTTLGAMLEEEVEEAVKKFGEQKMAEKLLNMPLAESVDISDIFGAFTQNNVIGLTGHSIDYWNGDVNSKAAREAFAEMYSAELSAPDSLKKFKEYFPKSYEIFMEILEDIIAIKIER